MPEFVHPIKIGIGVSSVGRFLPLIGQAAGLFERAGIPVEIVNQRDEERAVPDIVSGATPIGTPNAPSLAFSVLDGSDIVIIGGVLNRPAFFLAAGPGIETVDDLRGKRVGINEPKRMAGMVMLALLRKWGFDLRRDLQVVDSGVNDRSFEVLMEGKLDAALLPPEKAFLAEARGLRIICDSRDLDCHWVPLATTRRFLRDNRETARKVAAVYADSVRIFKSEPEGTIKEISRALAALADHPQVVEKCYRLFAAEFEPTLKPSIASIEAILREVALQNARARELKPSDFVDYLL